jgi:hypothetical protein
VFIAELTGFDWLMNVPAAAISAATVEAPLSCVEVNASDPSIADPLNVPMP